MPDQREVAKDILWTVIYSVKPAFAKKLMEEALRQRSKIALVIMSNRVPLNLLIEVIDYLLANPSLQRK